MTRKAIADKEDTMKLEDLTPEQLAELEKKAHAYDSEKGRLAKVQAENATLKSQIEQTKVVPRIQVDPRASEVLGDDGVEVVTGMLNPVMEKLNEIGGKLDQRDAADQTASQRQQFNNALEAKLAAMNLPGFSMRLSSDLKDMWDEYVGSRPALRRGLDEGDVETVSDMIGMFITQNREAVVGGYTPHSDPGGAPVIKSEYSEADYQRDVNALKRQRDNLGITDDEYSKQAGQCYQKYVDAQEKVDRELSAYPGLV